MANEQDIEKVMASLLDKNPQEAAKKIAKIAIAAIRQRESKIDELSDQLNKARERADLERRQSRIILSKLNDLNHEVCHYLETPNRITINNYKRLQKAILAIEEKWLSFMNHDESFIRKRH